MSQSRQLPETLAHLSRRGLLAAAGALGGAALLGPVRSFAQAGAPLPLSTPGLDHLDVIVEDVEATSRFYMGLLNTQLYAQEFRGGLRYFVLLGELGPGREVGYVAVGASGGRGTYIGHFCTSVDNYRRETDAIWDTLAERVSAAGLGEFPGTTGFGGLFEDPDGIEIQLLPAPDTLVTVAHPNDLVAHNTGLVTPYGLKFCSFNVSDLDRALSYYRILYGQESGRQGDMAWFDFPRSDTRLIMREIGYGYGKDTRITAFGIKTAAFDRSEATDTLTSLGASVLDNAELPGGLRFVDPDGITVELNAV
jgi:catechol 2,3-dioxygenase-like lactoylglutathione lyase family enzyme